MRPFRIAAVSVLLLVATGSAWFAAARGTWREASQPSSPVVVELRTPKPSAAARCEQRRQAQLTEPELPGVPALENARPEILARAKAEPVLFLEQPKLEPLPEELAELRERLHSAKNPWQPLHDIFAKLAGRPKQLRQVVLTDGYLYAKSPNLAVLLASVSLNRLFSEPELDVTRGAQTWLVAKKGREYFWANGPHKGQPAQIVLFDRIGVHGQDAGASKHVSVAELQQETAADRIEVDRLSRHGALATLVYGERRVKALLSIEGGKMSLDCEVIEPGDAATVEKARTENQRRARVIERMRSVVAAQVDEALPFDEPKTEEGQQDGWLRQLWRAAYLSGRQTFEFNGDEYPVFGADGAPRTPQVCVDFITDSWERMAGARWAARGERRLRHTGRLDLDALGIENRRRVQSLIDFAVAHPEWFSASVIAEPKRVRFAERKDFFRQLYEQRAEYQPGDVIVILGPRSDEKLHYHSFFIYAADPVTGMPTLVAANSGRPRIRTWEGEMQNAPLRSIVARIRPRLEWLESITYATDEKAPLTRKT